MRMLRLASISCLAMALLVGCGRTELEPSPFADAALPDGQVPDGEVPDQVTPPDGEPPADVPVLPDGQPIDVPFPDDLPTMDVPIPPDGPPPIDVPPIDVPPIDVPPVCAEPFVRCGERCIDPLQRPHQLRHVRQRVPFGSLRRWGVRAHLPDGHHRLRRRLRQPRRRPPQLRRLRGGLRLHGDLLAGRLHGYLPARADPLR
jgi:hypothetical protein